jgi:methionyl-tRNA synthetase
MIINTYSDRGLEAIHGIDMSSIDGTGVGAGWGRVQPGRCSEPQQHDEVETFVIVRGTGHLIADGKPHPVAPGAVVTMEPFETHQLMNVLLAAAGAGRARRAAARHEAVRRAAGLRVLHAADPER